MGIEIPGTVLLKALGGSHAYGLAVETSDEDYRGVFAAQKNTFYKLDFPKEVSDERNDQSYFELSKFSELLVKSNPSVLEFLAYPKANIVEEHPAFSLFKEDNWLCKKCEDSFLGYAYGQIRKAYKLKKRINPPVEEEMLTAYHFMEVFTGGRKQALVDFTQKQFSVSDIEGEENLYALWKSNDSELELNESHHFLGKKKGTDLLGYLKFRRQDYSKYLKEYGSFFKWKSDQDKVNLSLEEKLYDGKFMMHTFRLLLMAKDIAEKGELLLVRPEREFLLKIRNHEFEFSDLIKQSEELILEVKEAFKKSDLPMALDLAKAKQISAEIRNEIYKS